MGSILRDLRARVGGCELFGCLVDAVGGEDVDGR